MEKDAKIFVAGHNGLVGSSILRNLQKRGYRNFILKTRDELDLLDQQAVIDFFETKKPEYIFIAAARVGGIMANNTYKADFIYENLQVQNNVIHHGYVYGVKKLLFLGSSCIYPRHAPQPMKEEYLLTGALEPTNEPYAIAKIAGIRMCQAYNFQYGTNFISVMPTNLYGPNDNFNLETSHVLPALIRKLHLGKCLEEEDLNKLCVDLTKRPVNGVDGSSSKQEILKVLAKYGIVLTEKGGKSQSSVSGLQSPVVNIWGTGSPRREFMHVDDMADACVYLMENYNDSEFVNIGVGEDVSIKELALLIKNVVDYKGELEFDTSKPDGMPRKLLDVSKLKSLGWNSTISLKEGIRQTYEWYLQDQNQ